ncbi:hypothetical protein EB796_021863 [Bugula neritina]|uniref:Kinesin-like protein n=1 Tax=Bugula neritina TaxID=10212 RepID=A0A7J7J2B2_BUGNE|nr:hypothetical protein EB796_021863 [Bugula neritina]
MLNLTKQSEGHKQKLSVSDDEVARLRAEVEGLRQAAETTLSKQAVIKLEEQNTKLQDKLLRKEAEFVELDLKHQENEKLIGQLRLDLSQRKEQIVEKFIEIPVESEAAKLELAYYKSEAKELTQTINRVKNEHRTELAACETKYQETIAGMQSEISDARGQYTKFSAMLKSRDEKEEEANNRHKTVVDGLEKQLKQKKSELTKLRQDMVDKVVELEQRRDTDLENLQLSLTQNMADAAKENKRLKERLGEVQPQLDELRADYLHMRELCVQLQQLNKSETISVAKQLNNAISQVNEHNKDLVRKYRKEVALRKKYHNELVELKGNIRVFCRVRPVIKEDGISPHTVLTADVDDEDVLVVENSKGRTQQFDVDKLFLPEMSQEKVFDEVKALVTSCVDGYHVCIFAYGQTGSGKTYTMEGPSSDPGINQRALALLFEQAADRSTDWSFDIKVSVLEIYNETVRDLLSSDPSDKLDIKLNQDGNLHVPGLSWVQVKNVNEVNQTFELGHQNRATASTNMNEYSSRSHALLCVEVTGLNRTTGAKTLGKLHLVDLAGSERVSKSGADGARLKEAQSINKSLSALGDVIAALRSRQNFVPYRNSKLTYLLQESLGGDSKVLMIVQVAPVERHVNETLCSLNFAQRVRSVELGAAGRKLESAEVTALKGRLAHYENSSPLSTPTKQTTPYGTPARRK